MAYDKSKSTNSILRDLIDGDSNTKPALRTTIGEVTTTSGPDESSKYIMQYVDKTSISNVVYLCKERNNGKWLFTKINKSTGNPEFTFANISNNPTKTTYDLAFADRTSLTYEKLEEVTDL